MSGRSRAQTALKSAHLRQAVAAGGLRVICTSLGENVRFLNQFKGRSGRQGDPGQTYVVLSAEQDILGPDMEGVLQSIYKGVAFRQHFCLTLIAHIRPPPSTPRHQCCTSHTTGFGCDPQLQALTLLRYGVSEWLL